MEGETHFHLHIWRRAFGDGDLYGCDLCAVLYDDARVWSAYLDEADVARWHDSETDGDGGGICRRRMKRPVLVFVRQSDQLVEWRSDGFLAWLTIEGLEIVYKC